jgi:hypothetical protein
MKKHLLASALVVFIGGSLASACDDGDDSGYAYGGGESPARWCAHYPTCGSCTPVDGCGWCQTGVGEGMCAADPNECAGSSAFSWTWDPSGCFPTTDASASAPDASPADASTVTLPEDGGIPEDANPLAH